MIKYPGLPPGKKIAKAGIVVAASADSAIRLVTMKLPVASALLALKKNLFNMGWPIIALIAVIGLASCGAGDFATSLRATAPSEPISARKTRHREFSAASKRRKSDTPNPLIPFATRPTKARYTWWKETYSGYKDHPDQVLPWGGPIRVFRKQTFMDEWGPLSQIGFTGAPKNLDNGEIYTLDHRRLVAYRLAGRKTIPVQWVGLSVVRDNRWKFTTLNGGRSIAPKP